MEDVKVIKLKNIETNLIPGASDEKAGGYKRIIYPSNITSYVNPKNVWMAYSAVNPGYSPHRWHTHTRDKYKGYEVEYPKDLEEIYYIISGSGVVQWKTEEGKIKEEKVSAGDIVFFPINVAENQLFNNGTEKLEMVAFGCPLPKIIRTK